MDLNSESIDNVIDLDFSSHNRLSQFNRLVYPVVSRRSGGLSLGVNLNPDKVCTFNCVYCQVDRTGKSSTPLLKRDQILAELEEWLKKIVAQDDTYQGYKLKDIAFAGDGEPTIAKELEQIIPAVIELKKKYHLEVCKLILFTNGTALHKDKLQAILPLFHKNGGEIWFKLDFWDESSLKLINRSKISFSRLMDNLKRVGVQYHLVLQSCFFSWQDEKLRPTHYQKYVALINDLITAGVQIKMIQVYTLARKPTDSRAKPWDSESMAKIAIYLREYLKLPVSVYGEKGEI